MALQIRYTGRWQSCCLVALVAWFLMASSSWGQTYVSGQAATAESRIATSGAVVLEKGELGSGAFWAGGALAEDGTFRIPLPSGGLWGLHVFSPTYLNFAIQVKIKEGLDNPVPVLLSQVPPSDDSAPEDGPRIADITFNRISAHVLQVAVQAAVSNKYPTPRILAVDSRGFKAYRLQPLKTDSRNSQTAYSPGRFLSPMIPLARDAIGPEAWLFVATDGRIGGPSVVINGQGGSIVKPPMAAKVSPTCEIPGFWRSVSGELFRFFSTTPGIFGAESYSNTMTIARLTAKDRQVTMDYQVGDRRETAEIELICRKAQVSLLESHSAPQRPGRLEFTKFLNITKQVPRLGAELFAAHCAFCHYGDRNETKVGPGLAGLSGRSEFPVTGLPVTAENLRLRIVHGGERMPPFKNLNAEQVDALVEYLQGL